MTGGSCSGLMRFLFSMSLSYPGFQLVKATLLRRPDIDWTHVTAAQHISPVPKILLWCHSPQLGTSCRMCCLTVMLGVQAIWQGHPQGSQAAAYGSPHPHGGVPHRHPPLCPGSPI